MSAHEFTTSLLPPQPSTCHYVDPLKAVLLDIARVPTTFARNHDVRCNALEVSHSGQDNLPECGRPTMRCPGCGELADLCEDHLFEQEDGTRVCIECDGLPEFKLARPDAGGPFVEFVMASYKDITNAYASGLGIPAPFPKKEVVALADGGWKAVR